MNKLFIQAAILGAKQQNIDLGMKEEITWIPGTINVNPSAIAYIAKSLDEDITEIPGRCVIAYITGLTITINVDYEIVDNHLKEYTYIKK